MLGQVWVGCNLAVYELRCSWDTESEGDVGWKPAAVFAYLVLLVTGCAAEETAAPPASSSSTPSSSTVELSTTVAPRPPSSTITTLAAPQPSVGLSELPLEVVAQNLHVLVPTNADARLALAADSVEGFWTPDDAPTVVDLPAWWELPALGTAVFTDFAATHTTAYLQLAVYSSPELADEAANSLAAADASDDVSGEFGHPGPLKGFDASGYLGPGQPEVVAVVDRVLILGGISAADHNHLDTHLNRLAALAEEVGERAEQFAELIEESPPAPEPPHQPLASLIFNPPDTPTFEELGIGELEAGDWRVERCEDWADCRAIYFRNELFTRLHIESWPGLSPDLIAAMRRLGPQEGLIEFIATMWSSEDVDVDVAASETGLVRQLITARPGYEIEDVVLPDAKLSAWMVHDLNLVAITVGETEFEQLDPNMIITFQPVFDTLLGIETTQT